MTHSHQLKLVRVKKHFTFHNLLKTTLLFSVVVFFFKLFTLTTLVSAKDIKTTQPEEAKEQKQTVQLDSTGLVLKLDFMNLTPQDTQVLESLFNYREKLKEQSTEIQNQNNKLNIVESRIKQQITELKRLKTELQGLLNQYTEEEEKRIGLLVKIYENMKPNQAAEIFNGLPEEQVLLLLNRMKEGKTALILANMNPKLASTLTNLILTKRQLQP
jgi:flagellar motility protein MotE (MotC chaperone)